MERRQRLSQHLLFQPKRRHALLAFRAEETHPGGLAAFLHLGRALSEEHARRGLSR